MFLHISRLREVLPLITYVSLKILVMHLYDVSLVFVIPAFLSTLGHSHDISLVSCKYVHVTFTQTKQTVNNENISGKFIVF